jgi:hypothetical protein
MNAMAGFWPDIFYIFLGGALKTHYHGLLLVEVKIVMDGGV